MQPSTQSLRLSETAPLRYNPSVRKLWRIVFNSLTALSLLLCVATSLILLRSFWLRDSLIRWTVDAPTQRMFAKEVASDRGRLQIYISTSQLIHGTLITETVWHHEVTDAGKVNDPSTKWTL